MSKKLESFIKNNREAFDDAPIPEMAWDKIAAKLENKESDNAKIRKIRFAQVLKIAATVLFIGTISLVAYQYGKRQGYDDYSRLYPELAAKQDIYINQITQKKDSIAVIAASNPTLHHEFSDVLSKMEENYSSLKNELSASPNKELVLEAMIHNLRAQVEVLGQQMEIYNYVTQSQKPTNNEQQI